MLFYKTIFDEEKQEFSFNSFISMFGSFDHLGYFMVDFENIIIIIKL